jgi:hypothetical protein
MALIKCKERRNEFSAEADKDSGRYSDAGWEPPGSTPTQFFFGRAALRITFNFIQHDNNDYWKDYLPPHSLVFDVRRYRCLCWRLSAL